MGLWTHQVLVANNFIGGTRRSRFPEHSVLWSREIPSFLENYGPNRHHIVLSRHLVQAVLTSAGDGPCRTGNRRVDPATRRRSIHGSEKWPGSLRALSPPERNRDNKLRSKRRDSSSATPPSFSL